MFKVNVAPDMGMYSLLRSQGYDPAYALAEFVDNALHAYQTLTPHRITQGDPLKVSIDFYGSEYKDSESRNSIIITDNGPGIAGTHLEEAFKPAKHSGAKGLSEFGIGMKAAAIWFADTWTLTTNPTGESKQYELTFDLNSLLATGSDELEVNEYLEETNKKGTTLTLKKLRKGIDTDRYKEICETLKELYQRFTDGISPRLILETSFNKTPTNLKYSSPDRQILDCPVYRLISKKVYIIGKNKTWSTPISTIFNGFNVEGHISLLEKGSYTTNPGLVLFRNERVICGTTKKPFIPKRLIGTSNKFARQRVYGEIHMDEMPVSYTKDKFEFDENAFIDHLRSDKAVVELIRQAEEYRLPKNEEPIIVDSEADIDNKPTDQKPEKSKPSPASSSPTNTAPSQPPTPPLGPGGNANGATSTASQANFIILLEALKAKATSIALKSIIDETIQLYRIRRHTGAALCLRLVLELGVLYKIEKDFATEYPKVAEKGIKAVITYLNGNLTTFFDHRTDHRVIKCIQNTSNGTQSEIVLLNNIAHGHYQPNRVELDHVIINLEQLLQWAYS